MNFLAFIRAISGLYKLSIASPFYFSIMFLSPLLLLQLYIYVINGSSPFGSNHSQLSTSYLFMAKDMIRKAKSFLPLCLTISQNNRPMDCEEVLRSGYNKSGVYTIWPRNRILEDRPIQVYCDMDTDGGGWTVIQRRGNFGRERDYFYRDWLSYKEGFGDIEKDFWLGNDKIYVLSNQRLTSIRFDLKAVDGEKKYAVYDDFWIEDEKDRYRLRIDGYRGDAGDSMTKEHKNQQFTTKDQKHDYHIRNCAEEFKGAWWYERCHQANLNAMYYRGKHDSFADGVNWFTFRGYHESLDTTEMKLRPGNFLKKVI